MHILYVDESGKLEDPRQPPYFILAGVCVFERQTHWLAKELDAIAARFNPAEPREIELHGSPMAKGKGKWQRRREDGRQAIKDALQVLADSHPDNRLFVVAVEKDAVDGSPIEYAFTQLASRFDQYLTRLYRSGNKQRGIMLFDKFARAKNEYMIQSLTAAYRDEGHQWGQLKNFAEVPAFIDSRASRLIQLADLVAYAVNQRLRGDDRYFSVIQSRFDRHAGKLHGLHIRTKSPVDDKLPPTDG